MTNVLEKITGLNEALATLETAEDMRRFMVDLCTPEPDF